MKRYTFLSIAIIVFVAMLISDTTTAHQPNDYEILSAFENAVINVVEKSMPAIVSISTQKTQIKDGKHITHPSGASGFLFREDGYILTNEHVVENTNSITVRLHNGISYDAKIIGADKNTDVAVLKIDTHEVCPVLTMADPRNIRVGQLAIAIGDPLQYRYTVTSGIVSGKSRCFHPYEDRDLFQYHYNYIQTDAWIHPGSSGGPLLNIQGEVIGINTLKQGEGSTFAVNCDLAETIGQKLIAHGSIIRGYIDADMRNNSRGIRVRSVKINSAAFRGGLKRNDIILGYDGEKVTNISEFENIILEYPIGKKCVLKVLRNSQEITLNVPIEEMPLKLVGRSVDIESASWKKLGLAVRELGNGSHLRYDYLTHKDRGLVVEQVNGISPGFKSKVLKGMLIIAIDGQEVVDVRTLETILQQKQDGSDVILDVKGINGLEKITVEL